MNCTNCGDGVNAIPEGAMFDAPPASDPNKYRPFAQYGWIRVRSHSLSQNYNSLQITARREAGWLHYRLSYTFSKALGITGDSFSNFPADPFDARGRSYGPLPYDRTHSLSLAYTLIFPVKFRNRLLKGAFSGWQLTGISQFQSGAPIRFLAISGAMANQQTIDTQKVTGSLDVM